MSSVKTKGLLQRKSGANDSQYDKGIDHPTGSASSIGQSGFDATSSVSIMHKRATSSPILSTQMLENRSISKSRCRYQ